MRPSMRRPSSASWAAFGLVLLLASSAGAQASTISLEQALERAAEGPEVKAARAAARASDQSARAVWRATYLPKVSGDLINFNLVQTQALVLPTLGGIVIAPEPLKSNLNLGFAQISQTLFDPAYMFF